MLRTTRKSVLIMRKKIFVAFIILLNVCFLTISCSSEDDLESENRLVAGSKWIVTNWDYSIGDDYIGIHDYTINIYFYSDAEGLVYYGKKDSYSDEEDSNFRCVSHFNYKVSGDQIELIYITDEMPEINLHYLTIKGDKIVSDGLEFDKKTFTSADYSWLSTLHGKTGSCFWYHDLKSKLYIIGQGKMTDYTSSNVTPWASRPFNVLEVGEGVTSIGDNAFSFKNLGDVKLPSLSLKRIGNRSFSGSCISKVNLSNNITEIGDEAFSDCVYLDKIYLPKNIEIIGDYAFYNCISASLYQTPKLREIGSYAFSGCEVSKFTESEVLNKVEQGAFTDLTVSILTLPNSLTTLGHLAFHGNFTEIHVGQGLTNVNGTPFFSTKLGRIYVSLGIPLPIDYNFLEPASSWILYVPKGCKTAYSKANHWNTFKTIIEDSSLESGNGMPDSSDGDVSNDSEWGSNDDIVIPETYSNAGRTYKWIKVESPTLPTFYMMQTELDATSHFRVGDNGNVGILNGDGDRCVIKTEFRNFLKKIYEETGIQMRLPTKEEWQYAASGGCLSSEYRYSGGNVINEVAWYDGNSQGHAHDFAQKLPNELGFYDMSGNYGELTNDNTADYANVDGYICGGCFNDNAVECQIFSSKPGTTSGKIPGSNLKEKNAYDAKYITVRLVFTASD